MNHLQRSLLTAAAAVTACGSDSSSANIQEPPPPPENATVAVNTAVEYQTMTGWQANAQAGQFEPGYTTWRDMALDRAAADGLKRLRIDLRSGVENTRDAFTEWLTGAITDATWRCLRYATVNDNGSATSINAAGFRFSELDSTMARVVMPLRQRLQARGETLGITLTYVAFTGQICSGGQYVHTDPHEYAEFAVAAMNHMRDRWGVVPDTWELINEPDNTGGVWSGDRQRDALVALNQRLTQAGYTTTTLVAPSHASAAAALNGAQVLMGTPAGSVIDQIGYHRYSGGTQSTVQALGDLANSRSISTAMTEHIGSGYEDLIMDVTLGRASTWEQFTLAFPATTDDGGHYYAVQGSNVVTGERTKYLRHYFRHARRGAVRIGAESRSQQVESAIAFRNPDGRVSVIMKYASPGTIIVGGLPAGRYGIGYESETTSDGTMPDVTVGPDGVATLQVQSRGVVALYGRS
jgi:hypothetical protein